MQFHSSLDQQPMPPSILREAVSRRCQSCYRTMEILFSVSVPAPQNQKSQNLFLSQFIILFSLLLVEFKFYEDWIIGMVFGQAPFASTYHERRHDLAYLRRRRLDISEYFGSIDSKRTLRMAAYGMLILGPTQHFWFNSMSKVLPQRDTLTSLKKLFMGQAIFGPCITSVFFTYNAALQGENGAQILARLKRDLLPTLVNGLLYWPICDFITYKYIPVHLQPLVNSSCSYVWTIYLTYMASLTKVSTD